MFSLISGYFCIRWKGSRCVRQNFSKVITNLKGKNFFGLLLWGSGKMCNFVRKSMQMSGIHLISRSAQGAVPMVGKPPIPSAARFFYPCLEGHIPRFFHARITVMSSRELYLIIYCCCIIFLFNSFSLCTSYLFFC